MSNAKPAVPAIPQVLAYINYDQLSWADRHALVCSDVSLTRQSEKDESDINTIVKNFGITGKLPENVRPPSYGDFDDVFDFQSAMNAVNEAQASFMKMDADTRSRFGNDPQRFLEFCSDPANLEDMVKMGLAVKREVLEVPIPVPPAA